MQDLLTRVAARDFNLPHLKLVLRTEWASLKASSRAEIRRYLFENLEAEACILDLDRTPQFKNHSVSISHSQTLGGFAHSPGRVALGFDVELKARARASLVRRVSVSDQELSQAPDACSLWTAKEAAFKALAGVGQPRGLFDIEIRNWKPLEEQGLFRCEALVDGVSRARGTVASGPDACLALFTEAPCAGN